MMNLQAPTPVRPGKRRRVATTSPVTARSENRSPRAKQMPFSSYRQSPPTISAMPVATATAVTARPVSATDATASIAEENRSGSVSPTQLAVPRVSAEPPCPSALPLPPMHWMGSDDGGMTQRRQCRVVTESLVSHLTTSGILVTA